MCSADGTLFEISPLLQTNPPRAAVDMSRPQTPDDAQNEAFVLVQRYLHQLTEGCGDRTCQNAHCRSNPSGPQLDRKQAIQEAVKLAQSRPRPGLCDAILALPESTFSKKLRNTKRRKQNHPPAAASLSPSSQLSGSSSAGSSGKEEASGAAFLTHPDATDAQSMLHLAAEGAKAGDYRLLIRAVGQVFSQPEALAQSFRSQVSQPAAAVSTDEAKDAEGDAAMILAGAERDVLATAVDSHIDFEGLEEVYRTIVHSPARAALDNALTAMGLEQSARRVTSVSSPESLRVWVILLVAGPVFNDPDFYGHAHKLFRGVSSFPASVRGVLKEWLSRLQPSALEEIVSYLQQFITVNIMRLVDEPEAMLPRNYALAAAPIVQLLFEANKLRESRLLKEFKALDVLPNAVFYNSAVNDEINLEGDYRRRMQDLDAFCRSPALLDSASKTEMLHLDAHFQKERRLRIMMREFQMQFGLFAPFRPNFYLSLTVEREHLIPTTLFQIQELEEHEFKKPLQIKFEGEDGVDQGGVKKEYFQLIVQQLFDEKFGMFIYNEDSRLFWINQDSFDRNEFRLIGILLGLAIYNEVILDMHFPSVMYKKLLNQQTGLDDLKYSHPELHNSLRKTVEAQDDVSEWCLTFTASYESAYGEFKEVELKPGGSDIEVTNANREEYVALYVDWLLNKSIERQFSEFYRGFQSVCGGPLLSMFQPEELELLVCGNPVLDFEDLWQSVRWEDGYTGKEPVCEWLGEILRSMNPQEQRSFLSFTTGSDRAPIKGLGSLGLIISKNGPDSDRLPTSSTCFNMLLLPEYRSKEKLQRMISLAIANAQGFGLM